MDRLKLKNWDLRGTWIHTYTNILYAKIDPYGFKPWYSARVSCFCWCCIFQLLKLEWLWKLIGRP